MSRLGPTAANSWEADENSVDLRRPAAAAVPLAVRALPQDLTLDLRRTAVVVVDMQNDFCHPEGWLASIGVDVSGAARAVDVLSRLLPALRASGVPVIWLNWGNRPDRANLPPNVLHVYDPAGRGVGIGSPLPPRGSRVLEKDSWGAALVDGLVPADHDIRIDKFRMSGFFDTPLDSVLRNLRIDTVLFGGVNTDQCVLATLTDAACLGYDVVLVEDAAATTSPDFCRVATVYNVRQCFGFTMLSSDLLDGLAGGV